MVMTAGCEAVVVTKQHKTPCHDCPWRRASIAGWLGPFDADEWLAMAHGETLADCHARRYASRSGPQCAGLATFRANVCKAPRDPRILRLKANRETVFATNAEFIAHHGEAPT